MLSFYRRHASLFSTIVLFVGVMALVVAIVDVGKNANKTAKDEAIRAATAQVRKQLTAERYQQDIKTWHSLQQGCHRGLQDRKDAIQRDADLRKFAISASIARRREGNIQTAIQYEKIAGHTNARINRVRKRIIPCTKAFPKPPTPAGMQPLP